MKLNKKHLFGTLFSLFGFTGCEAPFLPIVCMYGQPSASYKILGDVCNEDGKPLDGIRVVVAPRPEDPEESAWINDTLYTDAAGHFEKERLKYSWPDNLDNTVLLFDDVAQGIYRSRDLSRNEFDLKQTSKGDGTWNKGTFTVEAHVTLQKED